jgi:hypothetical protein
MRFQIFDGHLSAFSHKELNDNRTDEEALNSFMEESGITLASPSSGTSGFDTGTGLLGGKLAEPGILTWTMNVNLPDSPAGLTFDQFRQPNPHRCDCSQQQRLHQSDSERDCCSSGDSRRK